MKILFPLFLSVAAGAAVMFVSDPISRLQWLALPIAVIVFIVSAAIVTKAHNESI